MTSIEPNVPSVLSIQTPSTMGYPPTNIRFRGAIYKIAVDKPLFTVQEFESRQKQIEQQQQKLKEKLNTRGQEPQSEDAANPFAQPPLPVAEHVKDANDLVEKAAADARKTLDKHKVTYKENEPLVSLDSDGVELSFVVTDGELGKGAFNNPSVIFDYVIKAGESSGGSFWEGFKDAIDKGLGYHLKGFAVSQVIFDFCDHYFGAEPSTRHYDELLSAVSFLQKGLSDVRAEKRLEIPKESADVEVVRDWVKAVLVDIWENRVDQNSKKPIENWQDITQVRQMIEALQKNRYINMAQSKKIIDYLTTLQGVPYTDFIKEIENEATGKSPKKVSIKASIERAVRQLTAHEQYSGEVRYGIDEKTGHMVAGINAPYQMQYIFDKQPGGRLKFLEAGMNICNQTLLVNTEANAKGLLSSNLTLAEAYKAAVNVEDRRTRKPQKDVSVELLELLNRASQDTTKSDQPAGGGVKNPLGK